MTAARRPPRRSSRQALAEETIRAIRAGEVDAFVMADARGQRTFAIGGEEQAYRLLMERMNEGAVTLTADGTVLYCNRRFAELVRRPHSRVLGASLRDLVHAHDQDRLDDLLGSASHSRVAAEFALQRLRGGPLPVILSLGPVPSVRGNGAERRGGARTRIVGVVTDITERREAARWRDRLHQRLMVAADEERRRLARELHDETGQSLTAMLVGLRALADAPSLKSARASALRLRELAARTVDDVGRLARGLHPSVLDEMGLVPAATRHVEEFERMFGLAVTLRTSGVEEREVPLPVATAVYRLLQEALTNIGRHAHARSARIALRADARRIVLEVRDDGIGFDAQRALEAEARKGKGAHLGLLSMRERTALFGGTLEVRSIAGRGTTITARLPLGDPALRYGRRARDTA
jgi:PAS domain S-box-containing protein